MPRRSLRHLLLVIVALATLSFGCTEQTVATTTPSGDGAVTPSTTPHVTPDGVVLVAAAAPFVNLDPVYASSTGDLLLIHQIYDWLVEDDGEGGVRPGLALSWEEIGPTVWSLTLRSNVIFQDGDPFGSEDVVYTFERLALIADSTGLGSPLSDFSIIDSVVAVDGVSVRFILTRPEHDFPALLARDEAAVLSSGVHDPSKEWVGTGPFVLWSYGVDTGAVLRKNPGYWMRDASDRQLPYLDGIDIVFTADTEDAVTELLAGRVHVAGGLDPAEGRLAAAAAGLGTMKVLSNEHLAVEIDCGPGSLGENLSVRRALKRATDRAALAEAVRPGAASPGNDSPVGPLFGEIHLDAVPDYDPEAAKVLLSEAGLGEGLAMTLDVPDDDEAWALAQAWKAQMAIVGVAVDTREASASGEGAADARIVRWPSETSPGFYFRWAGYSDDPSVAPALWTDAEFESLLAGLGSAVDPEARVDVYERMQRILMDRGPTIIPFFETVFMGADADLMGVAPAPYWPRTTFRAASFGA